MITFSSMLMVISVMVGPASAHMDDWRESFRSLQIDSLDCADYPCTNEEGDVGVYMCRPDSNSGTLSTQVCELISGDTIIFVTHIIFTLNPDLHCHLSKSYDMYSALIR